MTSNDKPYHIASGVNGVFALTDAKIAPRNPDGTYGEPVPIPGEIKFSPARPAGSPGYSFSPKPFKWSFEMTARKVNGEWIACRRSGKLFTKKMLHAMARKRERAVARMR